MKIPLVLAQESIARPTSRGGGGTVGAGQGEAILAEGLSGVSRAFGQLAHAQQVKQQQFGRAEAAQAAASVELDLKTFATELEVTERDPDRYLRAFQERMRDTSARTAAGLTTDEGRAIFQQRIGPGLVDLEVAARRRANVLYVERGRATLDQTLDTTQQLAAGVPFGDDDGFARHARAGLAAIAEAAPLIGQEEAGTRSRAFRDDLLEEYGHAAIETDRFNPADPRWAGMDPKRFEILKRRAETVDRARTAEAIRVAERQERLDAKAAEAARQAAVDALDLRADAGELPAEELEDAIRTRVAIGEDGRRLAQKLRTVGAAGGQTDNEVYNRLELDMLENPRSHGAREIRRLQETGKLAAAGPRSAATLLKMIPTDPEDAKDITQRPLFKQGLHEVRESLRGGAGPLEGLSREAATRLENAEREYHDIARSGKFGDHELPEVARKIVERVRKQTPLIVGDPTTRSLLRYQTPQDLLAAHRAGLIPDAEFNRQMALMRQLGLLTAPAPKETPGGGR